MDEMKKKLQGVDEIDQVEEQKKKKKLDYDEVEDEDGHHNSKLETTKRKVGGIRTMPFILGNEICDRFATSGFHGNMITYLTQVLNLPMVEATNTLSNFAATSSFTPLFGALIADSFAGRFWTITVASIIYLLGLISITISAVVPSLQPRECPSQVNCEEASRLQLWVVYISLLLTCIGTGGIRPCVVTFAADQLDMSKQSASKRSWNFFNWYYLSMGMATLLALTIVVYIQDNVGFAINIVATIVSSLVEMKRKSVASHYHLLDSPKATVPITVFWLVPQFCLHGVAEVFMSVGHLEFLYDQSPESMRSTAAALYWIAIAIGNYVGTILVTLVHKYTNWLPDRNLNRGRLDYYYLLVTAIQLINLIYYLICASCYTQKPLLHLERQHHIDHIITKHDDDNDNHHPTTPELINANPNPPLRDHVELISKA